MSNEKVVPQTNWFLSNIVGFVHKATQILILKNSAKWIILRGCHFSRVHHIDLISCVLNKVLPRISYLDKKIIFQRHDFWAKLPCLGPLC